MFREKATSALAGFRAGLLSWSHRNLEILFLAEGGKPENLGKNHRSKAKTNNKLNPGLHWWEASAVTTGPFLFPA